MKGGLDSRAKVWTGLREREAYKTPLDDQREPRCMDYVQYVQGFERFAIYFTNQQVQQFAILIANCEVPIKHGLPEA